MNIIDKLKLIGTFVKDIGRLDLYQQLIEASTSLFELQHENAELKSKIKILEEKSKIKDGLVFRNNTYWKATDNDGPFCSRCWDKNNDLIRMRNDKDITYFCPECKYVVQGPNHESFTQSLRVTDRDRSPRRKWLEY